MTTFISVEHASVVLNGHVVQGLSTDQDSIMMPDIEIARVERGATGTMYAASTGDKGGQFTLKLLPSSTSLRFFMGQFTLALRGAAIIWNGQVNNAQIGITAQLHRGVLVRGPGGHTFGKGSASTMEFVWEFERIIPIYDAMRVAPDVIPIVAPGTQLPESTSNILN